MNAQSPGSAVASPVSPIPGEPALISAAEIDRSCCPAVGLLAISAVKWLVLALLLGVISSIKLHGPGFLSDISWLTYGRIYPASLNALVYGFASQAALALALWMLARLGRVPLAQTGAILIGGAFWNVGLVLGIIGILAGHNTGHEWLEMPHYASPALFAGYLLIGLGAVVTFHSRRERSLYVSQWFLLAALLWFPWIYSTAQLLLVFGSVRGAVQTIVGGWYAHNLFSLWLTPVGLAAIFYFVPKILNRPLHSHYLALFAFWQFALFGSWGGLQASESVPKWISSISIVATVMTVIPILATATNWYLTMACDRNRITQEPALRFIVTGAVAYLLASALEIVGALRSVNAVTLFTLYESGVTQLYLYGFVGMVVAGALYYIVPRMTGCEWPSPGLIPMHYWLSVIGVALIAAALVAGGVVQGLRIQNPSVPFLNVVRATVPFLGMSTLGGMLVLAGNVLFLVNLGKLLRSCAQSYCACCLPASDEARLAKAATGGPRR